MQLRKSRATVRSGFTLMELLVVVAILVVLAGAAVPIYMTHLETAKKSTAWATAKTIETQCKAYRLTNGDYPASLQELAHPSDGSAPLMEEKDLKDPWQREYMYANPGQHSTLGVPDIWSTGSTAGQDAQIGNWLPTAPK
ncbi:GspG family T2SS major pseudopilin variant LspG [soil metagenome]